MTARSALGCGLMLTGHGDAAIESLGSLSASAIEPAPLEAELLASRGTFEVWWGDVVSAQEDLSAVVRWSRGGVPVRSLPNAYGGLAEVEFLLGRWDDGLAHADVAVSVSEDSGRAWDRSYVHAVAAYLLSARGNWDAASEHVAAGRRAAAAAPLPRCFYYACAAAGYLAWARSDWEAVLRELAPLQVLLSGGPASGLGKRSMQAIAAEAMLMSGHIEDSEQLVGLIEAQLVETLPDYTRIEVWRLRGLIEQARERPDQAAAAFERGRQVAGSFEAPLAEGLLDLSHGQFMRRKGSRRAAIGMLRAAGDRFAALKAQPLQVRCESELTACGVRSSERTGDNRYGLTAREELVARLVASGKSNREVAEELFLSTKAIEYHLGNVFAKVNIRSRHELAARLGGAVQ
jgi:DNA-binding CsgD family transcriptional regulator